MGLIRGDDMLKIALLQISPGGSLDRNLEKGTEYCRRAAEMGADIAIFPEMWSCGYTIPEDISELRNLAVDRDGEFVNAFGELAGKLRMAIGITYLERFENLPRNSLTVFDMYGRRTLDYSKVHTCDFGDERRLMPGEDFAVSELKTAKGTVQVGAMICYDREFPESARVLMLRGAELILVPNACPMEINRLCQLRGRAYENMLAIATCNYPSGVPDCNGHSTVFDGVAYLSGLPGSRDTCLLEAGESEGIYTSELDLHMLRDYRAREVHGNAYRRPEKYGDIMSTEIREPFIRADRRR